MTPHSSLRVLHLIHTPRHSGAESLVRDLCLRHREQGVSCAIAAMAPAPPAYAPDVETLSDAGVSLHLPDNSLGRMKRVLQFRSVIARFRPDAIFAHSVLPSLYGRLALPFFSQRPRFVTVLHSATNDDLADPYLERLEHLTRWRADAIVAVSSAGAENYKRRFNPSIPVFVIPNGIDVTRFQMARRAKCRTSLGLTENDRLVLQVGRISPIKQQLRTLHALRKELRSGQLTVWLAGLVEDPQYQAELEAFVRAEGIEAQVRFLGGRTDVPDLLASCDLYVMPSTHEAHSVAILEALASGCAVVASTIGAFQFCADWQGVQLCKPDDEEAFHSACSRLIGQGPFQRDLSAFTIQRTAMNYLDLAYHWREDNRGASNAR